MTFSDMLSAAVGNDSTFAEPAVPHRALIFADRTRIDDASVKSGRGDGTTVATRRPWGRSSDKRRAGTIPARGWRGPEGQIHAVAETLAGFRWLGFAAWVSL